MYETNLWQPWLRNFLFIAGCSFCLSSYTQDTSTTELSKNAQDAIVTIKQIDRRGEESGIGSGFFISSKNLVVTNLHVIGEGRPVTVSTKDNPNIKVAGVHAWSRLHDIAILKVEGVENSFEPLILGGRSEPLKKGQSVIAIGNPQGLENSVVEGVVSEIRTFDKTEMYQLAMPIEPGNSGGPLVDRQGRVHGVITLKSLVTDNLGFAVSIKHVRELLENPNPVSIKNWVRLGEPNPRLWKNIFGASWKTRHGSIKVTGVGNSFGGRSLLIRQLPLDKFPYEVRAKVLLDDESGAAGLVFGFSDTGEHWGFYPSAGNIRLTHFKGPDVFSWDIAAQISAAKYNLGEWNDVKVLVSQDKIEGFLNGERIVEHMTRNPVKGFSGLAKFRQTHAEFTNFGILESSMFPTERFREKIVKSLEKNEKGWEEDFLDSELVKKNPSTTAVVLKSELEKLRKQASALESLTKKLHHNSVLQQIVAETKKKSFDKSVVKAALLLGKYENPDLEIQTYTEMLDEMAEEILISLPDFADQEQRLNTLIDYLFEKNGFRGSRSDYSNTANSYLSKVLDDREGLPISLSVLFIELGQRLFIDGLSGAAFPGHFMIAWERDGDSIAWIDAFDNGRILPAEEVAELIFGDTSSSKQVMNYKGYSSKDIFIRMIRNLVSFSDNPKNLKYLDLLVTLEPMDYQTRFQRAFEYIQARDFSSARLDLEFLLDRMPEGFNIPRLRQLYNSITQAM